LKHFLHFCLDVFFLSLLLIFDIVNFIIVLIEDYIYVIRSSYGRWWISLPVLPRHLR